MKNYRVLLAGTVLLYLAVSCKKTVDQSDKNVDNGRQEALAIEPVTPLDKPIILPAVRTQVHSGAADPAPIVLVHGLLGWGPDEIPWYSNWGGTDNIPEYLAANGYPTYVGVVGSFSSNWDRAVELYYYIKGGYVDYGKTHSTQFGHAQTKSRFYPGIYPQWDTQHPIHLVGHSMGGVTIRKLITLLEKGAPGEQSDPDHAPLFDGGKTGWVRSVTTISTPHNGTTLSYILLNGYIPFVRNLVTSVIGLAGSAVTPVFDFKLEQWGLVRQPGESHQSYANRVWNSNIWETNDYSGHDVTPESAREANNMDLDSKDIYYFSFSTKASNRGLLTGWAYPRLDVFPLLIPIAFPFPLLKGIGNYTQNEPGKVVIDSKWWPNDGASNTYGMNGPENGTIKPYDPAVALQKGVWNDMGVYNGYDHLDIIGIDYLSRVRPFYLNMAGLLRSIE